MRIRYTIAITESDAELAQIERQQHARKLGLHVRQLRLLKSGQAQNLTEAAALVGYSTVQVTRWWARYRTGGLAALLQPAVYPGRPSRMTPAALARLQTAMEQGEIATVAQARQYVAPHDQIVYPHDQGMATVLAKHQIKKKTGRRRHRKASAAAQQAVKNPLRS
jgi:transposase